jgi:copper homeostasis protein
LLLTRGQFVLSGDSILRLSMSIPGIILRRLILPFGFSKDMTNFKLVFEVCANGIESAQAAQQAGVDRIELCENLEVDGLTTHHKIIDQTRMKIRVPMHVLIRPRAGDFVYSKEEFEVMKKDVWFCKAYGAHGLVFGILNEDGTVDLELCAEMLAKAKPFSCTFHRAFDVVKDPFLALEQLIAMGFDRVLTSGQQENCLDGAEMISQLVKQAAGRISIMAGGGISEENIAEVVKQTHTNEFHFSAKKKLADGSFVSDSNLIRKIKEIAEKTFYAQ